jgi:hypothetical protein
MKGAKGRMNEENKEERSKEGDRERGVMGPEKDNNHLCLEGAFLQSFGVGMSGFQDSLREKPSCLFMLSGWNSIFVASLKMHSMRPASSHHSTRSNNPENHESYFCV